MIVARLQVLPHHLDDARAGPRARTSSIVGAVGRTGALPGSVMPSASQTMCIEFAVPMPEQTPGPRIAFVAHARELVERDAARAT